jgi:hypothetical protein
MKKTILLSAFLFATFFCFSQNALHFDGTNDAVNCGTDTAFNVGGTSFTLEAWVNASSWKTNVYDGTIINKENNSNNGGYMLRAGSGGKVGFGIGAGTSGSWVEINTTSALLSLNTWHHIAATYDGSKMRLYVDGSAVDSVSTTISVGVSTTTPLTIGYNPTYGRNWNGSIDEVRVWNTVRTPSEISNNRNSEFCNYVSGMRAYYKFDQGNANGNNAGLTSLLDYSGENNTATLSGFALNGSTSNWVYGKSLSQSSVTVYDTISSCTPFYYPPHAKYYSASQNYLDTLQDFYGCDSIVNTAIIIKGNATSSITTAVCDSFISPNGSVYKKTGTYFNTLTRTNGCDSIITIYLTVGADTNKINPSVCYSYTSPSSKKTYTNSGIYYDTLTSYLSCDSIIEITLEVIGASTFSQTLATCDSILSPSGKKWMKPGYAYLDTITSYRGCDSLIQLEIKNLTTLSTISPRNCYEYRSPSKKLLTSSGTYTDTILNKNGCDSVITIQLTIDTATYSTETIFGCRAAKSANSKFTFLKSGIYTDTLSNWLGCDSIISMNVTVHNVNTNVLKNGNTLTAQSSLGQFQWLNCNNGYSQLAGENLSVFNMRIDGKFAVEVKELTCLDTSICSQTSYVGISDIVKSNSVLIYPNPNRGEFSLQNLSSNKKFVAILYDVMGKVKRELVLMPQETVNLSLSPGLYFAHFIMENNSEMHKIIAE